MADQTELERRLGDALARIEAALGRLPDAGAALDDLEAQLAAERETNEELIERVRALKERQETHVSGLEAGLAEARATAAAGAQAQAELKETIEGLRAQIARLTEANRSMVGDPDLVNTAMMVELEAMRATRRADAVAVDEILALLAAKDGDPAHA